MELPPSALPAGRCWEELCWTSGCFSWSVPWLFCKTGWGHTPSAWQKRGCVSLAHKSPEKLMLTKVHGVYYLQIESCGGSRRTCHLQIGKHCLCSDSDTEWSTSPAREKRREKTALQWQGLAGGHNCSWLTSDTTTSSHSSTCMVLPCVDHLSWSQAVALGAGTWPYL